MKEKSIIYTFCSQLFFFCFFLSSCEKTIRQGKLTILSSEDGLYEIYKRKEEKPSTLISSERGSYNKTIPLEVGTYVLFSECSKKEIQIEANKHLELTAHTLKFIPPKHSLSKANFFVECNNKTEDPHLSVFEKILTFRFFNQKESLKVNKKVLPLDFLSKKNTKSHTKTIRLASLRLSSPGIKHNKKYFLSAETEENDNQEVQAEKLNSERLLIPGSYHLSLNGSEKVITLRGGEQSILVPAILKVEKPSSFKEKRQLELFATSYYLHLNKNYLLFFNEDTPIFSGTHILNFEDSKETEAISIADAERKTLKPQSVLVSSICSAIEKDCLGQKDVFLFSEGKDLFFQGKTDISLFYFKGPIGIGFINSKGLIYWTKKNEKKLQTGVLYLKPFKKHTPGILSEFGRLESVSGSITGYSQDISHKKTTKLDLIEGHYRLVIYLNSENTEEKKKISYPIQIKGGKIEVKEFPFYVSEQYMEST